MKETTPMGDDALVHGCLNGENAAWAELHCLVRRLAGGLAGARFHLDVSMIEDVTQSTLENLLIHDSAPSVPFAVRAPSAPTSARSS